MQQESAIQAIKNIMKMLDITPEQLQDNTQSVTTKKNYTILEFRETDSARKDKVVLYDTNLYGYMDGTIPEWTEEDMLESVKDGRYEIYKVKRNSDGTIFTLGDLILDPISSKEIPITRFDTMTHYNGQMVVQVGICSLFDINSLTKPEQKKEPILVTEDDVEIYDGEKMLYGIQKDNLCNYAQWRARNCTVENRASTFIWFSTIETRDEYINNRRPKYSLNQIKEAYVNAAANNNMPNWDTFKQYIH